MADINYVQFFTLAVPVLPGVRLHEVAIRFDDRGQYTCVAEMRVNRQKRFIQGKGESVAEAIDVCADAIYSILGDPLEAIVYPSE